MGKQSQENRISPTHSERQIRLITALAYRRGVDKAAVVKEGVDTLFKSLPEHEIKALISLYEKMTPEQRKNPER